MTRLQMLEKIYSHLSAYYGVEMHPTLKVLTLPKAKVIFLYNVFKVNETFVGDDIRTIEGHIVIQSGNERAK